MNTFEIAIQRRFENAWPVVVKFRSADGFTTHAEGALQLSSGDISRLIELQDDAEGYGTLLGKRLFRDEVSYAFIRARSKCPDCLRVLLSIEVGTTDRLKTLHWERLCAPIEAGVWNHLALDQRLPFSLYIPTSVDRSFLPIGRRDLRALVLVASPEDGGRFKLAPFNVKATVDGVRSALGAIPCDVLANGVAGAIGPPTLNQLCEQLTGAPKPYTLLHIVSHGVVIKDGDTALFWANAENKVEPLAGEALLKRLRQLGGKNGLPHLTFLCACESAAPKAEGALGGLAQRLVRELAMPAVVAMTRKVSINMALSLGQRFYQRLRESGAVDLALQEAASGLGDHTDIVVPALFSRLGGRPLFSDRLEGRELTQAEIDFGLEEFATLMVERAPHAEKLKESFQQQAAVLGTLSEVDSATGKERKRQALKELNYLCAQVLEINFDALAALGKQPPLYKAECPFPGLLSFADTEYHKFFFGRDELIQELQKELAKDNFLAVLGPSGSGKSSLVIAGLIPKLQQQHPGLVLALLTPGSNPLQQLQTSIASVLSKNAAFVVDQFEELFTLCTDDSQRHAFIDQLLHLAQQQTVILTLRTDFLGVCQLYPKLSKRIEARLKLIGPMAAAELGKAMKMQANQVLLEFETGLSNAILAEVEGEPGAMPLLQYALRELWNRRRGRWLCYDEYHAIGGVQQAIATTATQFYNAQSADDQKHIRHIFEQLTRVDEDFDQNDQENQPKDTRRRVEFNQLITATSDLNQSRNLVAKLASARLVITNRDNVTNRDEVEVAHEALILYWPLLQKWLTESRPRLKFQQQLRPTIQRWQSTQDDGELLRGGLLQAAGDYLRAFPDAFSQAEKAFIHASQALPRRKPTFFTLLKISVAIAAIVSIVRIFGIMQPLEFAVYGQMVGHKPNEALDDRILIVGINESDIQNKVTGTGEGQGTVRDAELNQLLKTLQQQDPKVIALDLVRDIQAAPTTKLGNEFKKDNFVGICAALGMDKRGNTIQGVKPPFEMPKEQVEKRVGFSNFSEDSATPVRLQPLATTSIDSVCPTQYSFSYAIARLYLQKSGQQEVSETEEDYIQSLRWNQVSIPSLTGFAGGYQGDPSKDPLYKTLLNYRIHKGDPQEAFHEVSLQDVLTNKVPKEQIENKIVIIGIDSQYSAPDIVFTPFGNLAGVIVQAQMVSQIVSAVLDSRPLIWWLPPWLDVLWIGLWSTIGGFIIWYSPQPLQWVMVAVTIASLISICYAVFALQSGWLPLVPPLFAFVGTAATIAWLTFKLRQGNPRNNKTRNAKKLSSRTRFNRFNPSRKPSS
ncbi:MAG: CHASE2 domain-containing protein [Leptolyngbya sp. BL-A-14]